MHSSNDTLAFPNNIPSSLYVYALCSHLTRYKTSTHQYLVRHVSHLCILASFAGPLITLLCTTVTPWTRNVVARKKTVLYTTHVGVRTRIRVLGCNRTRGEKKREGGREEKEAYARRDALPAGSGFRLTTAERDCLSRCPTKRRGKWKEGGGTVLSS